MVVVAGMLRSGDSHKQQEGVGMHVLGRHESCGGLDAEVEW